MKRLLVLKVICSNIMRKMRFRRSSLNFGVNSFPFLCEVALSLFLEILDVILLFCCRVVVRFRCLCFGEQNGIRFVKEFPTLLIIGEQISILFK